MTVSQDSSLYKKAGVDIDKGDRLVSWIQNQPEGQSQTRGDRDTNLGSVVSSIGGFAGLYKPNFSQLNEPILVAGSDGVGTKVLLAIEHDRCWGLGIDLVAMCVNDLYTCGARPLFFLDYFATGDLNETQFKNVLSGIQEGLKQADTILLGGETAELPGLYQNGHFDLAGFIVGVVDNQRKIDPTFIQDGDLLYGLPSQGFHSNGYSLIRHWLKEQKYDKNHDLFERLLEPTKIYHEIPTLLDELPDRTIHGIAHITGGGISGNLKRILPDGFSAHLEKSQIPTPRWMQAFIEENNGNFESTETIFNQGLGMIMAIDPDQSFTFEQKTTTLGLKPVKIGKITQDNRKQNEPPIIYV